MKNTITDYLLKIEHLEEENKKLKEDNDKLQTWPYKYSYIKKLQKQNEKLEKENKKLKMSEKRYKNQYEFLDECLTKLQKENKKLEEENKKLRGYVDNLDSENDNQAIEIEELKKENKKLREFKEKREESMFYFKAQMERAEPKTAREAEDLQKAKELFEGIYRGELYYLEKENKQLKEKVETLELWLDNKENVNKA